MASQEWFQSQSVQSVVVSAGLMLILFSILKSKTKYSGYRLSPGPKSLPIIGNIHMILRKLPHRALQDLSNKYGPIMFLRLGSIPTVVVSSPEMAKEFLKTHDAVFASRPLVPAGKYLAYGYKDVAFAPYGPYWRHMKKLCTIELLTHKRLESFRSVREEEVSVFVNSIWEESGHGTKPVNITEKLNSLTTSVMGRIIASSRYSVDDMTGKHFKAIMQEMFSVVGVFNIGEFIPSLGWLDLQGIRRRFKKVHKVLDVFVEQVIDEHFERMKSNEYEEGRKDFVDVLLEMSQMQSMEMEISKETIKALVLEMFLAGVETSATTLEWGISELLRNPHVMKKAQKEMEFFVGRNRRVTDSDLPKLEYLQCVVKEMLRLHAPLPLMAPHESIEACTVRGYYIPAKTRLFINVWAIGRDPAVWEDSLKFKPERFIGKDMDVKGQDFELLPFGSGRRGCPGMSLALGVVEIALAQLVHCFEWSPDQQLDMTEAFGVTCLRQVPLYALPLSKLS
eukprot:Gb_11342 [translate_table: standard]